MTILKSTGNLLEDGEREQGFRRGYTHGAQAVIFALEGFLDEHRLNRLKMWAANELGAWRSGQADGFDAPAAPNLGDTFQHEV